MIIIQIKMCTHRLSADYQWDKYQERAYTLIRSHKFLTEKNTQFSIFHIKFRCAYNI